MAFNVLGSPMEVVRSESRPITILDLLNLLLITRFATKSYPKSHTCLIVVALFRTTYYDGILHIPRRLAYPRRG